MDINDIKGRFEQFADDFINFEAVENKLSKRRDIHAFLLLESLFAGQPRPMICAAEHDEFYLDVRPQHLAGITDLRIQELVRCGVRYDEDSNSLCMYA